MASDDAKDDLQLDIYGEALDSEEDLSLAQLRALATLRDRRPRMASLAAGLGLDRSTVTGLIARAEQRGPLRRTAAIDDGRSVVIGLTEDGRRLAERLTDPSSKACSGVS